MISLHSLLSAFTCSKVWNTEKVSRHIAVHLAVLFQGKKVLVNAWWEACSISGQFAFVKVICNDKTTWMHSIFAANCIVLRSERHCGSAVCPYTKCLRGGLYRWMTLVCCYGAGFETFCLPTNPHHALKWGSIYSHSYLEIIIWYPPMIQAQTPKKLPHYTNLERPDMMSFILCLSWRLNSDWSCLLRSKLEKSESRAAVID